MYINEIYRAFSTEKVFIEGFIADISARSGGRIVCTENNIDADRSTFTLTVDGIYSLLFRREYTKSSLLAVNAYTVNSSKGSESAPRLVFGNANRHDREAVRTWRYKIVSNPKTMLLELGGYLRDMTQTADMSMLSFFEGTSSGVSGARGNPISIPASEGYFVMQDNTTKLTLHDRTDISYSPDTPTRIRMSKNKQLYNGNAFALETTGMRDCMYVPAKLHFVAGGREYVALDSGSYSTNPTTASTIMGV